MKQPYSLSRLVEQIEAPVPSQPQGHMHGGSHTIQVSAVNHYGFCVITQHDSESSAGWQRKQHEERGCTNIN